MLEMGVLAAFQNTIGHIDDKIIEYTVKNRTGERCSVSDLPLLPHSL